RPAAGRGEAALAWRDRRAQRRLQAILAGDLACLGVLGHARRLRAPALEKRLTLQPIDQASLRAVRRNLRIPRRFRAIAHPRSENTADAAPRNPKIGRAHV